MNDFNFSEDLYHGVHLAAVLDIRYSELRRIVTDDPDRLPTPVWFGELPFWPIEQIGDWLDAGQPRRFGRHALEYLPAALEYHDSGRPDQPYAGWDAAKNTQHKHNPHGINRCFKVNPSVN